MSQALSKCLSKWIKVDKWDYFKSPSHELKKNIFVLGSYESLERLEGKTGEAPFFLKVQSGKITVWTVRGKIIVDFSSSLIL